MISDGCDNVGKMGSPELVNCLTLLKLCLLLCNKILACLSFTVCIYNAHINPKCYKLYTVFHKRPKSLENAIQQRRLTLNAERYILSRHLVKYEHYNNIGKTIN